MPITIPKVDDQIVVDLPNERTSAIVRGVQKKLVIAELTKPTMNSVGHSFRQGDLLVFKARLDPHRGTIWSVDPDHKASPTTKRRAA